jgi:hypothetical protein
VGIFDRSRSEVVTNLTEQNFTETRQTDQSGGSLNFSDIAGAVGITLNETTLDAGAVQAGIGAVSSANATLANSYGQSLSVLQKVNNDSLAMLAALASDSIDASRTIARDSASSSSSFVKEAVAGFGALAKQSSESGDDKIARVVGFALAAVAAVVVLPAIFKGGGKAGVIA